MAKAKALSRLTTYSLQKFILCRRQPLVTVGHLPVEILEQIFLFYVHEPGGVPNHHRLDGHFVSSQRDYLVSPMVLGQVNRQWREISRRRPELWSSIHIGVARPSRTIVNITSYWLSLAADSPLTLSLAMWTILEEPTSADIAMKVIDLFVVRYDKWQHVAFWFSRRFFSCHFQFPHYPPPILKSAEIRQERRGCFDVHDEDVVSFYSSSTLENAVWTFDWYNATELFATFRSWAHLKRLKHRCWDCSQNFLMPDHIFDILTACAALEHLEGVMLRENLTIPSGLPITSLTTHHRLRVLKLIVHPYDAITLFEWISLPALEEVDLFYHPRSEGEPHMATAMAFLHMLQRSSCKLQNFVFRDPKGPEDVLLVLLKSPHLQSLRILVFGGQKTSIVVNFLTRKQHDASSLAILPLLERLVLEKRGNALVASTTSIVRMLNSRIKNTKSAPGNLQLSTLKYVNLALGEIGFWKYFRLARLASRKCKVIPTADIFIPPIIQRFRRLWDFMGPKERYSTEW